MDTRATPSPSAAHLRGFGLLMGAMVVLFFGLLIPWVWELSWPLWPWLAGGLFAVAGLAVPRALGPVHRLWMALGHVLGWVNTRLVLGLVFFAVVMPVGLAMRLFRDPMGRRLEPGLTTYRQPSRQPRPENLERPF